MLRSDRRLEFAACWAHVCCKAVESSTYQQEGDQLLGMIQALHDVDTCAEENLIEQRKQL
ncbi:MAG: hypothetical protein KDB11_23970 [Planctomycetales bacterium]|nr:hypothetical protein [Planctomycetales bacterium]